MEDSELRTGEHILLRTQGIFIKSIPYEGILTNKRIILTDKTTIFLPQREIPLNTLRNTEAAEDAIGDQILRLTIQDGTSGTRQMVFTFSCQTGETCRKERDTWLRMLKENTPSVPEQEHHTTTPAPQQSAKKHSYTIQPEIEVMPPAPRHITGLIRTTVKKEVTWTTSTEWIGESSPDSPSSALTKAYGSPPPGSSPLRNKESYRLVFGVIFLILIIISTMMISITSTLYSQNSSEANGAAGISSSTPNPVSLAPVSPENLISPIPTDTTITPVPADTLTTENIPPGNSGVLIPDTVLVVREAHAPPVSESNSPYVTIEPKAVAETTSPVSIQPIVTRQYVEGYTTIYSLADQNVSPLLPIVSFTLRNPPLVIDYNVTPFTAIDIKHLEYKEISTNYEEDLAINRPYENAWFMVIVRNKDTGEIVSEDGVGGNYSLQTPKQLVVRGTGNFSVEFTGQYATLDLAMKVRQEGNFP